MLRKAMLAHAINNSNNNFRENYAPSFIPNDENRSIGDQGEGKE